VSRALVVGFAALLVAFSGGVGSAKNERALELRLVPIVSGLDAPVHASAPRSEPGRLYVTEQTGVIRIVEGGRLRATPFLDIRSLVQSGGEQGLLSVAFHPRYAENRRFFVNYTDVNGDTRVVEYRSKGARAVPSSRRELLFVRQPYANHNGGQVAFGPDGYLYVGMGDGGSGGDPENRAQNLGSRLGKLLRLNVDRRGAKWQIAGFGLRNPWRFSFDRETGGLYIGDVGQGEWEEIDYVSRASPGLENYGWDVFEGRHRFEDKEPNPRGKLVEPVAEYDHSEGCSVTGGFVYRGSDAPELRGRYFYGDYCSGTVWSLRLVDGQATDVRREPVEVGGLTSFGEDARGEIYLVGHGGTVYRLAG